MEHPQLRSARVRRSGRNALSPHPASALLPWDLEAVGLLRHWLSACTNRPALCCGDRRWTDRELAEAVQSRAQQLRALGATEGSVVGVALARDEAELVISVLAIAGIGATVLPLDAEHPSARLAALLTDSGACLLLTQLSLRERMPMVKDCALHCVESLPQSERESLPERAATESFAASAPELAYLIYTSGSTGEPKGVAMTRRALMNLVRWQCAESGTERAARTLQFTPATFDVFFQELFATLCSGGELVLVEDRTRLDPARLLAFLEAEQITRIFLPFVALQQLAETAGPLRAAPRALREVITAGEQLLATDALRAWLRSMPECRLVNQYGPSETHVVTQHVLSADSADWPALPPIGRALPGVEIFLLDAENRELPDGEVGELHLGGLCLAAGYLGRPELTRERFREAVGVGGQRRRLYRTGDLARRNEHGEYEFLGRADQQIKLRGHRIEPGEIEVQLAAHPGVAQAVVALREGPCGPRLVAYVVSHADPKPSLGSLRQHLEQRLPAAMIPASFLLLDTLPLTRSGKVDRKALPEPSRARPELGHPATPAANKEETIAARIWSELLALDEVGVLDNFFALGGDSLSTVRMAALLSTALQRDVPVTAPFRQPTIRGLLQLLSEESAAAKVPQNAANSTGRERTTDDVAVIGMSLRVPGAENVEEFWQMLLAGGEGIHRFSVEELRAAGIPAALLQDPDYVPARGCLQNPLGFDADFFGIPPREAELMDPQQRLFLESCWSALEAAGYAPDATPGVVGVWGGVSAGMHNDTYLLRVLHAQPQGVAAGDRVAAMLGNQNDYLSTRVSHKLNLRGPSVSVQSACSTSLLAIAEALQSLRSGDCDVALAGGACVLFPQTTGYLHQEGDIASSDGSCRPFDARADGTVFGDGVGVVVLKRLRAAIADGDRIHAVLKGAGVTNDGANRMSFGAPSADGQAEAVRSALRDAHATPESIGYVEAHGTATPIGDPIEVTGLCSAFGALPSGSCVLGSVKSNVGHLISAAGVTGFIKTVLALEHGRIPATAHFERAHPSLALESTPFFVSGAPTAWPQKAGPRRAGVSSFGLGGTNVHLVLEEAPELPKVSDSAPTPVLLPLSARNADALRLAAEELAAHLQTAPHTALADVAFTLQQGRHAHAHRRAVVANDFADAVAQLRGSAATAVRGTPRVVFLFPGVGSQHPAMGLELYRTQSVVREVVDRGLGLLEPQLGAELRALWLEGDAEAAAEDSRWERPSLQLPAIFLFEVALARLWMSWGITPDALLGHSMGEYAAAHLAGTMNFEQALGLVALRGRLFESLPPGGMLSVSLSEVELSRRLGTELDLAVVNGAESCVASGPRPALAALAAELKRDGVDCAFVRIPVATHSRRVEPILAEFRAYLDGMTLQAPRIPIASNHSGAWLRAEDACSAEYWAAHLRDTVRFADGLRLVSTLGAACLIEVGPGRTLTSLSAAQAGLADSVRAFPSTRHGRQNSSDLEVILGALGAAWCAGLAPHWESVLPANGRRRLELPGTRFERHLHAVGMARTEVAAPIPAAQAPTAAIHRKPAVGTRRDQIRQRLAEILSELSGLDPKGLDPQLPFLEMGFDSLFLTQASLGFKREFKAKISFHQLCERTPTLDSLATHLDQELAPEFEIGGAPATTQISVRASAPATTSTREPQFNPYKAIEKGTGGGLTERQRAHLDALMQRVLARTPKSKEITARHRRHFADARAVGGFKTLWKEIVYPIAVDRSKGAYLWDVDGNRYVDCVSGFGAILFGHSPDFLVEATVRQAQHNLDYGPTSALAGELAQRICAMTGMERASFCNTGTEAVLATMRLARTVTGREKIVVFSGDYHGLLDETLVRRQEVNGEWVNLPAAPGIPRNANASMIVLEYGAAESLDFIRENADELAAVLVEPVQSRAPELQPREFLLQLRRITEQLDVPLIFDEIITGFRVHPGGAQAYYGVRADLASYGKVIGAGMPVGIVAGKAEFLDALDGGNWNYGDASGPEAGVTYFAGTFMRHPLALAAVKGALDLMEREGPELQLRLNQRVAAFAAEMNDDFERARLPLRMRHFASMIYPKYGGDSEFEELYFHHLRVRGVHIAAHRPGFLTTAHSEADFHFLRTAFLAAAESMLEGGFLSQRELEPVTERVVPFTEAQEELWLTTRLSEGAALSLNEPCAFELKGRLNLPVLRRALGLAVERHDALRSSVPRDGSGFRVHSRVEVPEIEILDLSSLAAEQRASERERIYRADSREPFALARAPLLRVRLLRLAPEHHELLITVHHLVCDGWSISILFHDLSRLYSRLLQGRSAQLEPAPQLEDFLIWEGEQKASDEHRATLEFWQDQFRSLPTPLELPLDAARPPSRSYRGNRQTRWIPAEVGEALKTLATERKCTLFTVLLAAYVSFLHRLADARDHVIGIPSAGQALLGSNALIAHCVHYLPFRVQTGNQENFLELLERVRCDMQQVHEHQEFTFGTLLKSLRMARDASRPTLVAADFNLDPAMESVEFAGLEARYVSTPRDYVRIELMFNLIEDQGALLLECDHATDLITVATAATWMKDFETLLRGIAADATRPLDALQPLESLAACATSANGSVPVHERFSACALAHPAAPAVVEGNETLSYAELDAWSDALAHRLREAGVACGTRVGLHLPRSLAMVAAQYAVWKTGGVIVPLDPAHPLPRRRALVADAGLCLLLHREGEQPSNLAEGLRTFAINALPTLGEAAVRRAPPELAADAPAYLMYTSGSTGEPKGVEVGHAALSHLLDGFAHSFGVRSEEAWLALTTPTFDISLLELHLPLTIGARVVLVPGTGTHGGPELLALVRENGVKVIQATPSTWHMLIEAGLDRADDLRAISGGEALRPALASALARRTRELWNVYGPTEATIWASIARLNGTENPVPIGTALPGYGLHLLDANLCPMADGEEGELFLSGAGLAHGYVGRPEETARAFLHSPHLAEGALRIYRTGDRARRLPSGDYECLGRLDQQFKLRGHRIEGGEIEIALERLPGVAQAVIGLRDGPSGETRLVAWIRAVDSAVPPAAAELRAALAEHLPRALLPQQYEFVEQFPLNVSGKIDRATLVVSAEEVAEPGEFEAQGAEALLAMVWRELLGGEGFGPEDDFFLLGGSSLLANRMLIRVEDATGVQLELDKVFLHPTIRSLAEVIDARLYRVGQDQGDAPSRPEVRKEIRL